jgi:glycosyltransferase involved in cell wall biosynthesis
VLARDADRRISAVMLSWESADILERVVRSTLEWADDLFVLDTGSTDGSQEILDRLAHAEKRLHASFVSTSAETFNHGRCINQLLAEVDEQRLPPYWLAKIDCDEMFETGFVELCLPVLRALPGVYTQVSFLRPDLWYSETRYTAGPTYREAAFQRWAPRTRYPETPHHLHRTLTRPPVTFYSRARLLHYGARTAERSKLQYDRLLLIDREWPHYLVSPDTQIELEELVPLRDRGGDRTPRLFDVALTFCLAHTPDRAKDAVRRRLEKILGSRRATKVFVRGTT